MFCVALIGNLKSSYHSVDNMYFNVTVYVDVVYHVSIIYVLRFLTPKLLGITLPYWVLFFEKCTLKSTIHN